jgi:hypothetical protein
VLELAAARPARSLAINRGPRSGQLRERSKGVQLKETDVNHNYSQKINVYKLGIVPVITVCTLEKTVEAKRMWRRTVLHRSFEEFFETWAKESDTQRAK